MHVDHLLFQLVDDIHSMWKAVRDMQQIAEVQIGEGAADMVHLRLRQMGMKRPKRPTESKPGRFL